MKRWAQIVVTMLLLPHMRGQQPVAFDTVRFNSVGSFAIGFSVFETDSGYLVFGDQKGQAGLSQDIYATKFDGGGGLTTETSVATYQQDDYGTASPVARAAVSYYVGSSRGLLIGEVDSLYLYRFNAAGDTLWSRFIATDTSLVQRATTLTRHEHLLLAGTRDPGRHAYIFDLDSTGASILYHPYDGFNGEDVVEGREGKWYLCGRGNQAQNYNHPVVLRSDTLGNQLWRSTLTDYGSFVNMVPLQDSCVLALGIIGHSPDDPGHALAVKYDTSGTEVWRKELFQTDVDTWPSWFHAGYEKADSSLVLAGWYRSYASGDQGLIMKLNHAGDTLWHRFYSHYPGAALGKDQIFWDVKPTSDGGMVLTGETNSDDYPYAQLWLLKLDSMGCLVPGCGSVGVQEYTDLFNGKLVVSPNPARERVSMALDLSEGVAVSGQVRAVLLDATGHLVREQQVRQNLNKLTATMDVSALPAGTYYLHLRDGKRWLAGSKVVVE